MKKVFAIAVILITMLAVAGCSFEHESDVVSRNISREADSFNIPRRVVFYNGITDTYMLSIEGYCALGNNDSPGEVTVVCKVGDNEYKKHFLGLSDNVTYFAEQLEAANVSKDHYLVVFRPQTIVPDIEIR